MAAVWKARKSKSPFPLFPHCLGKLAKTASFPHSHSFGDDLGFPFSPSSFNFNFNEKCYLLARYLLLPTCPFAQQNQSSASQIVSVVSNRGHPRMFKKPYSMLHLQPSPNKRTGHEWLSVVNPVGIFGPALGPDFATSILIVQRFLNGAVSAYPRISFGVVDVRDVAELHLRAMTNPAAKGERFLAVAGETVSLLNIATILKKGLGAAARRVPTRQMPDWLVRFLANFIPDLELIVPELGKDNRLTNEKARRVLGWAPRSNEDCMVATGESLLRLGLL